MTDINNEEEIENSKAPLVSHLIELRDRLKWAVIAFFIAFLGSYFVADHIYTFLVKPLEITYKDMGYENIAHVNGGFGSLANEGFQVVTKEKK